MNVQQDKCYIIRSRWDPQRWRDLQRFWRGEAHVRLREVRMLLLGRKEGRELYSWWGKGLEEQPVSLGGPVWWEQSTHGGLRPQREKLGRSSNIKTDQSSLLGSASQT